MIRLVGATKIYPQAGGSVTALEDVSLDVPAGQFLAVMGPSGSGKSTLLNLVAGLDVPTRGEVWVDGRNLARMDDDALTALRRETIGLVFQFFNLLAPLDVRENVALPALLAGRREKEALGEADRLIEAVGLGPRARSRPHMLSGGEMQRAAICRALIHRPKVLLADEPTGNLDSRAAAQILTLLRTLSAEAGTTVVLVTHSREAAASAARVLEMRDGSFMNDVRSGTAPNDEGHRRTETDRSDDSFTDDVRRGHTPSDAGHRRTEPCRSGRHP
jgi:putative ABC transport system ATP-binding protein